MIRKFTATHFISILNYFQSEFNFLNNIVSVSLWSNDESAGRERCQQWFCSETVRFQYSLRALGVHQPFGGNF